MSFKFETIDSVSTKLKIENDELKKENKALKAINKQNSKDSRK